MLNKPHPFIFNRGSILIPFVITFLVFVIFRPFGFTKFSNIELVGWAFVFGSTSAFCVLVVVKSLQKFTHKIMDEEKWTVGKEIGLTFLIIMCIMLVVFGLIFMLNPEQNINNLFQVVVFRTTLISIFPVIILVLYEQYHFKKNKLKEVQELNNELVLQKQKMIANEDNVMKVESLRKLILTAENQKMVLHLDSEQLYFIKSEGNYVTVYYLQNQKVQKELVRISLKAITEQLPENEFFRCHKSYLINLQHIKKVEGNARNLELVLENIEERIPVSRSKSESLFQYI